MISIKESASNTIIVNKSKFISFIHRVNTIDDVNNCLLEIRDKYSDASHICYSYILENIEKSDDDREPKNSAGKPMLDVLKKNKLNFIIAITVRYFGGIKLGKGNLTRTYKKSISNLIKKCKLIEMIKCKNINIIIDYNNEKLVSNILQNIEHKKIYGENIIYNLNASNELLDDLSKMENIKVEILKETYIEKPITK